MTVVVGLLCENGVALGADGAATLATTGGSPTARTPTRKLEVIGDRLVLGFSGDVGFGQRVRWVVERLWDQGALRDMQVPDALACLQQEIFRCVSGEFDITSKIGSVVGPVVRSRVVSESLIAVPLMGKQTLLLLEHSVYPTVLSRDLPFVAIGSGKAIADPFLAFLRRIFWKDDLPTIAEGVFAVVWTLQHTIKTSPGGIADPWQVVTLERDEDGEWRGREHDSAEMQESEEMVGRAETYLRAFADGIRGAAEAEPSPTPEPPAFAS